MLRVVTHRQKHVRSSHMPSKTRYKYSYTPSKRRYTTGLKITAGQWTMSGLIGTLTGQTFVLPVMLTRHIGWSQVDATFTGTLSYHKVIAKLFKSYREVIATWQL